MTALYNSPRQTFVSDAVLAVALAFLGCIPRFSRIHVSSSMHPT
jgi:hypothetical protein